MSPTDAVADGAGRRTPGRQLGLIAAAQVLVMACWFSASAVVPALRDEWGVTALEATLLTVAVQVAVTVAGEVLLYFLVREIVERGRPDVPDLTAGLPTAGSWPSGHAAAAVAVYGSLAAVVIVHSTARWRWGMLALPALIAMAVSLARVYEAAHYPSDVVAGMLLGTAWTLACVRLLLLPCGSQTTSGMRPGTRQRTGQRP